jgi:hypothetical protein
MRITNLSDYIIIVSTREFSKPCPKKRSIDVPDDVGKAWSAKPAVKALIADGIVKVFDTPDANAPKKRGRKSKISKALEEVSATSDLDMLELMLGDEERPEVKDAIQMRMSELT